MQVVLRQVSVRLRAASDVRQRLARAGDGRPVVVDAVVSAMRGWLVGDLVVGFVPARDASAYVEIEALDDVRVVVDRRLVSLLRRGARIVAGGGLVGDRYSVRLDHPEDWLDLLDGRPIPG